MTPVNNKLRRIIDRGLPGLQGSVLDHCDVLWW